MGGQFTKPVDVRRDNPIEAGKDMGGSWVHHSPLSSTVIAYWAPGGGMKPHYHEVHDEILTVVEGKVDFRLGDEVRALTAGDVVNVAAGTIHAPIHTKRGCLVVSVFAPRFDPDTPDRIFVDE
jgi:quercetin dioxygenase-like cupin family protein